MLAATNNPAPQFYSAPSPSTANAMMMEHQHQHQHQQQIAAQRRPLRKRKPEAPPENNERLSKRLSLLNLGRLFYLFQFFPYPAAHSIPPSKPTYQSQNPHISNRVEGSRSRLLPTTYYPSTKLPTYLPIYLPT